MTISRRHVVQSAIGLGAGLALSACKGSENVEQPLTQEEGSLAPSFPQLPNTLLVNRERAADVMKRAGVAAIICAVPANIYYVTNYWPIFPKLGMDGLSYAILPADPRRVPVLIENEFAFYLSGVEALSHKAVDLRLFTAPVDAANLPVSLLGQAEAAAFSTFLPTVHEAHPLGSAVKYKRDYLSDLSAERYVNSQAGLVKAVLEMGYANQRLAVDDALTQAVLTRAKVLDVNLTGENLLRDIRLQKSTTEIEIMRYAANANAGAALAAAKLVRDGANFSDIRHDFYRQCGERAMTPRFMVIDGVLQETGKGEIKDGRSFSIDCVSHHRNYHGDYGRTVCVGEPTAEIKRAAKAISDVWDDLLPRLKPGVKYNEVGEWASAAFAKTDSDANLICNPHSVGLRHTDEPSASDEGYFVKDNLELLDGMIMSVDLPMVDVGLGGSAHLEDLVLITPTGAELLNDKNNRFIIV